VHNKYSKIPPSTSMNSKTRVPRSRDVRLSFSSHFFMRKAATRMWAEQLVLRIRLLI